MANRINPGHAKILGGFKVESTPEMLTVEALQAQLADACQKGEKIIHEATEEIMKRNACLQEGMRVMNLCRDALIKYKEEDGGEVFDIVDQIDRWMGPAPGITPVHQDPAPETPPESKW